MGITSTTHHHKPLTPTSGHRQYANLSPQDKARLAISTAFAANPWDFHTRFHVRKVIGFGSNGVVLAAQDLSCTTGFVAVAIKIIYKDKAGRIEPTVPHEIRVLRGLSSAKTQCPYAIRTMADWQDLNHYYLVSELFGSSWIETVGERGLAPVEFECMYQGVRKTITLPFFEGSSDLWAYAYASRFHLHKTEGHKLLPLEPVKRILKQTAIALSHMHDAGIYHGDVKNENILVAQDGVNVNVRLADFGHAREWFEGIRNYGTRAVSPPEFLADSPFKGSELDGRCSDVFALGIVLFGLLNDAGRSAPAGAQGLGYDGLKGVRGGAYPVDGISDLDEEGRNLLESMCRVDPGERISISQVVGHKWLRDVVV
ncbi:hypothetical protein HDU98_008067 [Podochytrium sp. JEL0797]|nr:hypothetical protein HDU98_008067 [Podochytrium sp. JEL0797]